MNSELRSDEEMQKLVDQKDKDIRDLTAALMEIMDKTGDTETVFYIAQEALRGVYGEPDNMEAIWGGWV